MILLSVKLMLMLNNYADAQQIIKYIKFIFQIFYIFEDVTVHYILSYKKKIKIFKQLRTPKYKSFKFLVIIVNADAQH